MQIRRIEVFRIALPFDAGRRNMDPQARDEQAFNAASRSLRSMESLLVKLTTDTGMVGWGEAFGHLVNPVTFAALAGTVGRFFIGSEIDDTPASIGAVMQRAHQAFHAFGRTGPVLYALSAIDIALWDLAAQKAGQPLHRLLGAKRDTIGVYASLVSYDNDPHEVAYQVRRAHRAGFTGLKLHETSVAAIAAARKALPATVSLSVDVNCAWPAQRATAEIEVLRAFSLGWIEEPIWPPDDLDGLARAREGGVAIAAGENVSGVQGFLHHFEHGAVDIAQPSVTKIGGISAMLEVIALARRFDARVIPHCFYYGAGLMATAHIVALLGETVELEVPWLHWPTPLYAQQPPSPSLTLPNQPGLGFVPDPDVLEQAVIAYADLT